MTMPNPYGVQSPGPSFPLPQGPGPVINPGAIFTVAMMKAGRNGCTCESCLLLQKIAAIYEKHLLETPDAPDG